MPNLGDYLGHLVSEITIARMQADLEAIRVAELYAGHPLLSGMPVPRFRLPAVELDLPVAVQQMEEPPPGQPARGSATPAGMREAFDRALAKHLAGKGMVLTPEASTAVKTAVENRIGAIEHPAELSADVIRTAEDVSHEVAGLVMSMSPPPAPPPRDKADMETRTRLFSAELAKTTLLEFLKLRGPPPRLQVMVASKDVREYGSSVIRIKLRVSEHGIEWVKQEEEGRLTSRLVAE